MKQPNNNYSLETILAEREKVLAEIRTLKTEIKQDTQSLFAAPKTTSRFGAMVNSFDKAIAIYDGVVLGMRVVSRFKYLFGKKRIRY